MSFSRVLGWSGLRSADAPVIFATAAPREGDGKVVDLDARRGAGSRFERIACGVSATSPERRQMLGLLLGAAVPGAQPDCPALKPLWADEAMQRACDLLLLFSALERRRPARVAALQCEWQNVRELSQAYAALDSAEKLSAEGCAQSLRTIARGLVALFGPIGGAVQRRCYIEPVALPRLQLRALALIVSKCVTDALLLAAREGQCGRLTVNLVVTRPGCACLRISFDPIGQLGAVPGRLDDVVVDLALLLECEPTLYAEEQSVVTELWFPLAA